MSRPAWLHQLNWRSLLIGISLALIPVFFVFVGVYLKNARGPYWLGSNYDPDYAYFMNAMNIIEALPIGHFDHPGTPVQLFSALMIQITHLLRNNLHYDLPTLETDALTYPELYLQTISYTLLIINALLLFAIGVTTYLLLKNVWFGLILQATPFLTSYIPMNSLVKVAPEALLLTVVLLLLWLSVVMISSTRKLWRWKLFYPIAFGAVIGLGIATKMNLLPMTVFPLLIVRTVRLKILYVVSGIVFFFIFTLPIRKYYPELFGWLNRMFQSSGIHGVGDQKIIDWPIYWGNLKVLIDGFPYIVDIIVLFLLLTIVSVIVLPQRWQYMQSITFRVGIAAALTQVAGLAFIAKHMLQYYFLPFVPLTGLIIVCALVQLRQFHHQQKASAICLGGLFILLTVQSFSLTYTEVKRGIAAEKETKEEVLALRQLLAEQYSDYTIFHYFRSSSQEFALKFGNNSSRELYNYEFTQLYPNYYFYEIGPNQFVNWDTVIDITTFLQQNPKVILTGSPFETVYQNEQQYRPNLTLTNQFNGTAETFYTVTQ